ncbi:PREDICTED: uncharacterized protein LOC104820967 isoform X2 [Tarenaya hassleriana]|uniref:uncharacterized protein LOC104820967 isoform X2 n=1 Tax=Tarenaya hassleriana TaxID=28532 RepID=UPI00053C8447|nr:PREDICTED: uncharacterized protein LOC104820967 isoform X2 [Tarenaya hassleriana]
MILPSLLYFRLHDPTAGLSLPQVLLRLVASFDHSRRRLFSGDYRFFMEKKMGLDSFEQRCNNGERERVNWNPTMEQYFIDLMLDQMNKGTRLGHTFSRQAWTEMSAMFNAKFRCKYHRDMLKTHYSVLWKQYHDVKELLVRDGFMWDDAHKMVVSDSCSWDDYIKGQPDAAIYRGKSMPHFDDLCLIYAYTKADGRYSRSSHDLEFDDEVQGLIASSVDDDIALVKMEHAEPEWTAAMDRYFIELMMDQTRSGNRNNDTFHKHAWKDMCEMLNSKFCSHYSIGYLKLRHKELSEYYCDIQNLLKQNGFFWDEERQIILAENDVWDSYIKVNPEAQSLRNETLLGYRDLCLIYDNKKNNGPRNLVQHDKFAEDVFLPERSGHFSAGSEILKVSWTPSMDRYLIDLLLDQALRGNQIGDTFTDEAWTEMTTIFTRQFGAFYDNVSLKQQLKVLHRQYNDINILLEQSRFYWDDTRETVVAEDHIWGNYIKEHPEAAVYRNKSISSYHKLGVIFFDENSHRRCSELGDADLEYGEPDQINRESSECPSQSYRFVDHWTPPMDRHLIDLMLQQVYLGNRIGSSFCDESWAEMSLSFVDRFGLPQRKAPLKTRHKHFKRIYDDLENLLSRKGFSWDEKLQTVKANNYVWDVLFKDYPDAKCYRGRRYPNYNEFFLIYGDSASHAIAPRHKNDYAKRTDWTPPMDRYFIDLMLEQVRQGNKLDKDFNKIAWDTMATKFISLFGHRHDRDMLKSRFLILRKRFNDMKTLLKQPGFFWDEARQMVLADHCLWDAYIKEHPNARSYHKRSFPSFNDLFLIFGDRCTDGLENLSCLSTESGNVPDIGFCRRTGKSSDFWGKKRTRNFRNGALRCMIDSLNEQFRLQCSKYFSENQYQRLMMEYRDVTYLLKQDGFEWDGFLQMVVAKDDVWEAHIKEHPEAARYRDRSLTDYEDLCLTFGDNASAFGPEPEAKDCSDGIYGGLQCPGMDFKMPSLKKQLKSPTYSPVLPSNRKVDTCRDVMFEDLHCPGTDFETPSSRKQRVSETSSPVWSSKRKLHWSETCRDHDTTETTLNASSDGIFGDPQCPVMDSELPNKRKRRKSRAFSSVCSSNTKILRPETCRD